MTPRDNCYILGYRGPNRILEDVPEISWNFLSVVWISEPEDEPVTRGMTYNFIVLNSPVTGHLGKMIINTNWWNQFWWNIWFWIKDMRGYLSDKFYTYMSCNVRYIIETVTDISAEEIGKLGFPVPGASLHCFQKRSTLDNSIWRDISFYPIRS